MKKENDFVLPEKWCIQDITKPSVLENWLNCLGKNKHFWNFRSGSYYHFHGVDPIDCYGRIFDGYTEISFEQFQKYVLNEKPKIKDMEYLDNLLKRLNVK